MSYPKILKLLVGCVLLVAVFVISAGIASDACSVINEEVSNEQSSVCVTVQGVDNVIVKSQSESVTFAYPAFYVYGSSYGAGRCAFEVPTLSTYRCYPLFESSTVGACDNPSANCVKWQRKVWDQEVTCGGVWYCSCYATGYYYRFYYERTCPTPGSCGGIADFTSYPSTGCQSGFVHNGTACQRSQTFQNQCAEPTGYDPETCSCPDGVNPSPIIVDVDHSGFALTDAAGGVVFNILNDGVPLQIAWIAPHSTNAFLVLDRDGNGTIDNGTELFGDLTPQPPSPNKNGFLALAEYDKAQSGGNGDGKIAKQDAVFATLRLWQDANHNGVSESNELHKLKDLGLKSIDLDFKESKRVDQYGNQFRYRSKVKDTNDAQLGRWAWDVFLQVQ